MHVNTDACDTSSCRLECVDACRRMHNDNPPLYIIEDESHPRITIDTCTICLACVRACPLNAIVADEKREHRLRMNFPETIRKVSDYSPYEIEESYQPMSEADTIFARVQYDPEFQYYQKTEFSGAETMISKDLSGYGRFEHELSVAAWKLYDSRQSIRRPGIGLDPEASEIGTKRITNPSELTKMVKKAAQFFGASLVGIAPLNRSWLYTFDRQGQPYNVPESMEFVVVIAIEMDYDAIATSPAFTSSAETALCYSKMAFIEVELSAFIQRLGYNAMTCGNNVSLSVPQAIDAGLGQYGRHGLLITKKYGPRVRIAKVITDMPLVRDYPDEGFCRSVVRFCEICEKCAASCPSQSIAYGLTQTWKGLTRSNNPGVKKWFVDVDTCYSFWIENGSECSNCVRSCPYNKKDRLLHRTVLWLTQHTPWLNRLIVKVDDILGYGKKKNSSKFWNKFSENG